MKLVPPNRVNKPGALPNGANGANGHGSAHPNGEGKSKLSWQRVRQFKQSRFNPLRNLTPAVLSRQLDDFALGFLREFALTADAMERRDDTLKCVAPKRRGAVARRQWEVCTIDGLEEGQKTEAEKHVEALQFFYNHATAADAVERNQRGGTSLLFRQMLDCLGKKYAVHEIIFQPSPEGLTAQFNFVPLWFFENLTGELRFLEQNFAYEGTPLEPGAWMVTVGEGLMEACAVAWMYKHLPLRDWLIYSQDFGRPPIEGITDAAEGSAEWNQLVDAVEAYSADLRTVHNRSAEIKVGNVISGTGEAPFAPLVERMDRAMAALWRGADLSTMSAGSGEGSGASLQGKEEHNLEADDAQLITETLNAQIDPLVIAWTFGDGVKPLAYIKVIVPPLKETTNELAVDTFLRDSGAPLEIGPTLERYGRPLPEDADADALLERSTPAAALPPGRGGFPRGEFAANEASVQFQRAYRSFASDMQPLALRLSRILDIQDETILRARLQAFVDELPSLLKDINADPESAHVLTDILESAFNKGLRSASQPPPALA